MSGMVLTPVSPTPEKTIERQGSASESERPAERFEAVSAREKARLEQKDARQDRADRVAEEDRVARQKSEQQRLEENRAKPAENADESGKPNESARSGDKASESSPADKETTAESAGDASETPDQQTGAIGDEILPMLFGLPLPQESVTQGPRSLTTGVGTQMGTQSSGMAGVSTAVMDKLMMQPLQQGSAGGGSDSDSLLGMKSEQLGALVGKSALGADGKAADFSAQLARFQGSGETGALQNNATALQRGLEGRESQATLKSYSTSLDLPVQHAQWGEKVTGKLAWLTAQRMSTAEIHITPPDLGPLEVRVQVQQDQAHVTVHATHSAVRDQLELNGHRLRDMLQENGLTLEKFEVSADASDQGAQQQLADEGQSGRYGFGSEGEGDGLEDTLGSGSLDLSWRGEVDLYA
ncbi:flagellar hook-length control protein FliK [Marinobacter fonticola]|uniref:flagellar hook-length control protein FliK n=1 Tax=Marinobacter fonticola TaxID=2603215 RepID=UPI0011E890C8|nr:flagellar hook-length control protein FliK [Marinobacter fonticola]